MWSRVALEYAEIGEELGDGLGGHRGDPVGVEGELAVPDAVVEDGLATLMTSSCT